MSDVSWNTRYGRLSSVPMSRHDPLPVFARNVTSLKELPPTSAATCWRSALGDGTRTPTEGACRLRGMCFLARYTTADSGATVTSSSLSPPVRSRCAPEPQTFSHLLSGTNVGTDADAD